ncbi:hypothetical protein C1645_732233 [Glomus cerebriforme]|uniref:Uncharacterized protein n=1 Tax=Glomus cerebriforme TaxID=658196 RepID=A0A397TMI6_9GLOM|nr:hypothetical protein C1645_732233 [Glomus cerebriforme]
MAYLLAIASFNATTKTNIMKVIHLGYTGDITNSVVIYTFIESDLTRNYGCDQIQHLKKNYFGAKQDKKSKHTKKVNYIYINDPKNSTSEEISNEKTEKEVSEKTDEENSEPQNCFSIKKKTCQYKVSVKTRRKK